MEENKRSILMSGVPASRGRPVHYEDSGDVAVTNIDGRTNAVLSVTTPQDAFRRVHELMHARHTNIKDVKRTYAGICDAVQQIAEDCRLHLNHWPWREDATPDLVRESTRTYLAGEMQKVDKGLAENPAARGAWPDFATRLRQDAVRIGLGEYENARYVTSQQRDFADSLISLMSRGKTKLAAQMMQEAFFPPTTIEAPAPAKRNGKKRLAEGSRDKPAMEIIELPHTEAIPEAAYGYRRATSGSRLHRPSLRKPILPQRLFVRRSPQEPHGTILIDASGSMGDWDEVTKWCELAPFGTIAYYAGGSRDGWLYVYARDGKRAREIVEPERRGNTVDGAAIDWLMTQAKPRTMITDREFCGALDSEAQIVRLDQLERAGEITVKDYTRSE
jgi:hypothetical protein